MRNILFLLSLFSPRKGRYWWSVLFWTALVAPAQASLQLRVAIEQGVSQVKVGSSTIAVVRDYSTGKKLGQMAAMNAFYAQPRAGGVTVNQMQSGAIAIVPTGNGSVYIGDRWYRGTTLVFPTNKGLTAVNYIDLEQYLYSVLGSEKGQLLPSLEDALKRYYKESETIVQLSKTA